MKKLTTEEMLKLLVQAGLPSKSDEFIGKDITFVDRTMRSFTWRIFCADVPPKLYRSLVLYVCSESYEVVIVRYDIPEGYWEALLDAPAWWNKSRKKFVRGTVTFN